MSILTYHNHLEDGNKDLIWLHGEVKTPPMSDAARIESGYYLRKIQQGELLSLPISRPMPTIGARCYELRIVDTDKTWRIVYRIDTDAIVILEVFGKKTRQTPQNVINACKRRIKNYDEN